MDKDANCLYCNDGLNAEPAISCSKCAAPQHFACWSEHGGCGTYACESNDFRLYEHQETALLVIDAPSELEAKLNPENTLPAVLGSAIGDMVAVPAYVVRTVFIRPLFRFVNDFNFLLNPWYRRE